MALTVKHLNGDASFLLSFEPVAADHTSSNIKPEPFRILLDPWITGPSTIFHPKIAVSSHKDPACVSSLGELPEPDLVIISQHMSDHCNEATLRQLPATGTKTIILAEPASARLIRSWKYFDKEKVRTIPKWEGPRTPRRDAVIKIPVTPTFQGGHGGEVTVAFVPQRKDISGLHSAVGITYRPPQAPLLSSAMIRDTVPERATTPILSPSSPPSNPKTRKSYAHLTKIFSSATVRPTTTADTSPQTPTSPGLSSLRSVRSASSLPLSVSSRLTKNTAATTITTQSCCPMTATNNNSHPPPNFERPLSVLFSPHGISHTSLNSYTTSHLAAEGALPLTALLHCFDSVSSPWWLGGKILLGAPAGTELAARLGARAWISAHDGDKEMHGIANGFLKMCKRNKEEVADGLAGSGLQGVSTSTTEGWMSQNAAVEEVGMETEVIELMSGEEVRLTREGVCKEGNSNGMGTGNGDCQDEGRNRLSTC